MRTAGWRNRNRNGEAGKDSEGYTADAVQTVAKKGGPIGVQRSPYGVSRHTLHLRSVRRVFWGDKHLYVPISHGQ